MSEKIEEYQSTLRVKSPRQVEIVRKRRKEKDLKLDQYGSCTNDEIEDWLDNVEQYPRWRLEEGFLELLSECVITDRDTFRDYELRKEGEERQLMEPLKSIVDVKGKLNADGKPMNIAAEIDMTQVKKRPTYGGETWVSFAGKCVKKKLARTTDKKKAFDACEKEWVKWKEEHPQDAN